MKRITGIFAVLAAAFLLAACSSALDRKYSRETFREDLETFVARDLLSKEDLTRLGLYMTAAQISGRNLEGMTYREMLKEAREAAKK